MEYYQENLIIKLLEKYPMEIDENTPDINYDNMESLLSDFTNGYNMKLLSQIINKFLFNHSTSISNGIYKAKNIFQHSIGKLYVDTPNSNIYTINIGENISVIIKSSKNNSRLSCIIREYFIGIWAINKLRHYTPVFVYTLGAFRETLDDKKEYFVMYEKIPGKTLTEIMIDDDISFSEWLLIFVQLLISLEVGQRKIGFTHFDLHTSNVIIRKDSVINYKINFDTETFVIKDVELLPVIIDFGQSTVFINDTFIGSHDLPQYGMLNFIVPGYDMYKLLWFSFLHSESIKDQISTLFNFFDHQDKLLEPSDLTIKNINEQCKNATFSTIATKTPMLFLEWIFERYDLNKHISRKSRDNYVTINKNNLVICESKINSRIVEYMDVNQSYIMLKYFHNLCDTLGIIFNQKYYKNSDIFLQLDKYNLEKVFAIPLPTENIVKCSEEILNISLRHNNALEKQQKVNKFLNCIKYENDIKPYLQLYYTILELNLNEFADWEGKFLKSDVYNFYLKYRKNNRRVMRWCNALLASIMI